MRFRFFLMTIAMAAAMFGSTASYAQIETLVMPGEVIEGHAELEAECSNCHKAFDRARQRATTGQIHAHCRAHLAEKG